MARIVYTPPDIDELVAALKRVEKAPSGSAMEAAIDGAEVLKDAMNKKAPGPNIDTNADMRDLRKGIVSVLIGPLKDYWYYKFFEYGTTAHEVGPRDVKAIRFIAGNENVFSAGHSVSGMAARPFMRNTMDTHKNKAVDAIIKRLRRAIIEAIHK
jgi:HK97 gp10 family phage protein